MVPTTVLVGTETLSLKVTTLSSWKRSSGWVGRERFPEVIFCLSNVVIAREYLSVHHVYGMYVCIVVSLSLMWSQDSFPYHKFTMVLLINNRELSLWRYIQAFGLHREIERDDRA